MAGGHVDLLRTVDGEFDAVARFAGPNVVAHGVAGLGATEAGAEDGGDRIEDAGAVERQLAAPLALDVDAAGACWAKSIQVTYGVPAIARS